MDRARLHIFALTTLVVVEPGGQIGGCGVGLAILATAQLDQWPPSCSSAPGLLRKRPPRPDHQLSPMYGNVSAHTIPFSRLIFCSSLWRWKRISVGAGRCACIIGLGSPSVGLRNSHDQRNLITMVVGNLLDPSITMTDNKELIKTVGWNFGVKAQGWEWVERCLSLNSDCFHPGKSDCNSIPI